MNIPLASGSTIALGAADTLRGADTSQIVILGIGNSLLMDEGFGPRAVARLRQGLPSLARLTLVDGGTLSYSLLPVVEEAAALIVIDAARLGLPPGTVRRFTGVRLDRLLRSRLVTAHEVGLKELFDMARLSSRLPRLRALIAVEPGVVDWGMTLSPEVAAAMESAILLVQATARRWQREPPCTR